MLCDLASATVEIREMSWWDYSPTSCPELVVYTGNTLAVFPQRSTTPSQFNHRVTTIFITTSNLGSITNDGQLTQNRERQLRAESEESVPGLVWSGRLSTQRCIGCLSEPPSY